jgi:hypothetical protein
MPRLAQRLVLGGLLLLLLGSTGVAALYLMPVSVALGPCLKDWTNTNSWRPRTSPLASTEVEVTGGRIKICYGRPSARGRIIFGSLVPYGEYWRLGANEPTRLFTNVPLRLGGIAVPPGRYSLYAIPERGRWQLAINRSRFHWGNDFSERVVAREIGRAEIETTQSPRFVETLTIRLIQGATPGEATLVIEWEHTRAEAAIDTERQGDG